MNTIGMKRTREDSDQFDGITAMANCLMLLSCARTNQSHINPNRVFECKTCNRQFPSFQALGGHRASHKKPKLGGDLSLQSLTPSPAKAKAKAHECSVCGQEFAVGQALGGHMRRHRAAAVSEEGDRDRKIPVIGKNSNSVAGGSKRVWGLDLNLTPLENDYLEFGFGKMVSASPVLLDRGV